MAQSSRASSEGSGPTAPVFPIPKDEFFCIEYPGIIKNVDKALETLGGMEKIQEIHAEKKRWMPLNFRPNHHYSRPIEGERAQTTRMVLQLTVNETGSASGKFIGTIPVSYKFRGLADYAYVPKNPQLFEESEPNKQTGAVPDWDCREDESKLHVPPLGVTVIDMPVSYNYQPNTLFEIDHVPVRDSEGNVVGMEKQLVRKAHKKGKRRFQAEPHMVDSNTAEIPTQPFCTINARNQALYDEIKKLFDERPIWFRNGLLARLDKPDPNAIKTVLPAIAYLFIGGPWRKCWVRLGYDPRTDNTSRKYQIIDFRVTPEMTRGQSFSWWGKQTYKPRRKRANAPAGAEEDADEERQMALVMARENDFTLPPSQRQTFYQFCEISIPAVQKLLSKCRPKYHNTHGWLPYKVQEKIRELMRKRLRQLLEAYDAGTLERDAQPAFDEEPDVENEDLNDDEDVPAALAASGVDDSMQVDDGATASEARTNNGQNGNHGNNDEEDEEEDDEEDEGDLSRMDSRGVSNAMFGSNLTAPQLDDEQRQILQSMMEGINSKRAGAGPSDLSVPQSDVALPGDDIAPFDILGGFEEDEDDGW